MSDSAVHPVDIYVGSRLRVKRIMQGMSQQDLGSCVGVTFQQVQKYEKGLNRIGASRLYDFSTALRTHPGYFFEDFPLTGGHSSDAAGEGFHERGPDERPEITSDKDVLLMVRYYQSVKDPLMKKRILSLVRSIAAVYENGAEDAAVEVEETLL